MLLDWEHTVTLGAEEDAVQWGTTTVAITHNLAENVMKVIELLLTPFEVVRLQ
jgi:hypothetical protein